MDRKRRILLHPGFRRTGTASVAAMLAANRAVLEPHLAVLSGADLDPAAALCEDFSADLHPLRLADLVETLDALLARHRLAPADGDPRDLLLSSPRLSGLLPGTPAVPSYEAAPITAAYLAGYFADRFPDAEVALVFTTRSPRAWLQSVWTAQLAAERLMQDWTTFSAAYARAANLDHAVLTTAHAVAPIGVYSLPLEEAARHSLGPGGALLELFDLPGDLRAHLLPGPHAAPGPDAALAVTLLDLNRSGLAKPVLQAEKDRVLRAAAPRRATSGGTV